MVVNNDYKKQLWIGWLNKGGFNYEIKGLDSKGKAEICNKFIHNLRDIQEFYSHLANETK